MCVFILFSPPSLIIHINVSQYDTIYCTTPFYSVQLTMDDGSSKTCLDWLHNMNSKNIVWFIKAISYFELLRNLGNIYLLYYRHDCFTKFRRKYIRDTSGVLSSLFKISLISLISSLSLKLYLNSLVYDRNIFRSSLKVFVNLREMFRNVRLGFGTILENLRKTSESGRKSSQNRQKRRHQYAYIIKHFRKQSQESTRADWLKIVFV